MSAVLDVESTQTPGLDATLPSTARVYKNKRRIGRDDSLWLKEELREGVTGWIKSGKRKAEYQFSKHFGMWRLMTLSVKVLDKLFPDQVRERKETSSWLRGASCNTW